MKAYLAIVSHQDNRNRQTIEQISQILTTCGFETICIRRDVEQWGKITPPPHSLLTTTLDAIRSSQLVVIDATEADARIGIEVGYAYAHSVPVFTIAREGTALPITLYGLSSGVAFYRDPRQLHECFVQLGLLNEENEPSS